MYCRTCNSSSRFSKDRFIGPCQYVWGNRLVVIY